MKNKSSIQFHEFKEETTYVQKGKGILHYSEDPIDFLRYNNNGHTPEEIENLISNNSIKNSKIIMDVISNPSETKLLKLAKRNKKIIINGLSLAFHQALAQFKLFTGKNPPVKKMQNAVNEFYK